MQEDRKDCSLCGTVRVPLDREGKRRGACTFTGCKDPLYDYNQEHPEPTGLEAELLDAIEARKREPLPSAHDVSAAINQYPEPSAPLDKAQDDSLRALLNKLLEEHPCSYGGFEGGEIVAQPCERCDLIREALRRCRLPTAQNPA